MAQDKKKVIVYSDWITKFEALSDDEAGRLVKHFFRYINDLNPEYPDRITELSFIDIKNTLKRDLKKWEKRAEASRENGKKGGRPITYQVISKPKKPVSDSVNVSVSDSVTDNVSEKKKEKFIFRKKIIEFGFDENLVDDWLKVRKDKKASNTQTAFNAFVEEIGRRECDKNQVLRLIIERSWAGFKWEWYDNIQKNNNGRTQIGLDKTTGSEVRTAFTTPTGNNPGGGLGSLAD